MIPETVRRAQAGDESAFAELYTKYKERTYFLCLKMTQDHAQAEDLTQDTFLCAHQKLGLFRGDSAFSTWLYRIAMNMTLMSFRKKRVATTSLEELAPRTENPEDLRESRFLAYSDGRLEQTPNRLALERAIKRLARGQKLVFILKFIEGYEHNEIAETVGCSVGNCKSQLYKARQKVAQVLRSKRTPGGNRL